MAFKRLNDEDNLDLPGTGDRGEDFILDDEEGLMPLDKEDDGDDFGDGFGTDGTPEA